MIKKGLYTKMSKLTDELNNISAVFDTPRCTERRITPKELRRIKRENKRYKRAEQKFEEMKDRFKCEAQRGQYYYTTFSFCRFSDEFIRLLEKNDFLVILRDKQGRTIPMHEITIFWSKEKFNEAIQERMKDDFDVYVNRRYYLAYWKIIYFTQK